MEEKNWTKILPKAKKMQVGAMQKASWRLAVPIPAVPLSTLHYTTHYKAAGLSAAWGGNIASSHTLQKLS